MEKDPHTTANATPDTCNTTYDDVVKVNVDNSADDDEEEIVICFERHSQQDPSSPSSLPIMFMLDRECKEDDTATAAATVTTKEARATKQSTTTNISSDGAIRTIVTPTPTHSTTKPTDDNKTLASSKNMIDIVVENTRTVVDDDSPRSSKNDNSMDSYTVVATTKATSDVPAEPNTTTTAATWNYYSHDHYSYNNCMIVSNKYETIFLSSNGDVLSSRCRYTPYPYTTTSSSQRSNHNNGNNIDERESNNIEQQSSCCSSNPFITTTDIANDILLFATTTATSTILTSTTSRDPQYRRRNNHSYGGGGLYGGGDDQNHYTNHDYNEDNRNVNVPNHQQQNQEYNASNDNNNVIYSSSYDEMKISDNVVENNQTAHLSPLHTGTTPIPVNNMNTIISHDTQTANINNASTYYHWYDPNDKTLSATTPSNSKLDNLNAHNNKDDDDDDNNSTSSITNNNNPNNAAIVSITSFDYSQYSETSRQTLAPSQKHNHTDTNAAASNSYGNNINGNTATASSQQRYHRQVRQQPEFVFHGIPTFVPYFTNIKIQQVSAHPMGSHVLLISQSGLLYTYGSNKYGQLGIGSTTTASSSHKNNTTTNGSFIMRPTIVTALLENGGKTIACAAGVSHSLVVVEIEEQRIIKSKSYNIVQQQKKKSDDPSKSYTTTTTRRRRNGVNDSTSSSSTISESVTVKYHQMYGFGRNDYMKIGLISPKVVVRSPSSDTPTTKLAAISATNTISGTTTLPTNGPNVDHVECVKLPRRVALRCSVLQNNTSNKSSHIGPSKGIFSIAASAEHSAALVHQPNGDIELYTWGNATYGTLGIALSSSSIMPPMSTTSATSQSVAVTTTSTTPTAMRIAPHPSLVSFLSKSSNRDVQSQSMLLQEKNEFPVSMSLSRCCSFVVTNIGRCFSFGTSEDGMLGLGRSITETHVPMPITMPEQAQHERIRSVSAGTQHVTICTDRGHVYAWGSRSHAGIDAQTSSAISFSQQQNRNPLMKGPTAIEELMQFEWSPRRIEFTSTSDKLKRRSSNIAKIVQARTGHDCTFFITEHGKTLSSGKNSGRLGQGEYETDLTIPKPIFGGLHLFHQQAKHRYDPGVGSLYSNGTRYREQQQHGSLSSFRSRARRMASV